MPDYQHQLDDILLQAATSNASDVHFVVGHHPTLRIDGALTPLVSKSLLIAEDAIGLAKVILGNRFDEFEREREVDLSHELRGKARFRVNVYWQRGFVGIALRLIPSKIRTVQELSLPEILESFMDRTQGFLLAVGPTGHGKSTTLAALIDYVNHTRSEHIITIEDPIEYLFTSDKSVIEQREVGFDTLGFHQGLRAAFREDIDVLMIGEMRDPETMQTAVTAAETGHLVLSSLHTNNAAQSIDRIIDAFPSGQQGQIRTQLANTLIGIVSQRLIPRVSGGLVPAAEVMVASSAIRNLIREEKIHEIDFFIETRADQGMVSLNRSLADLVRQGEITLENAIAYSLNPQELETLLRRRK